ncbi:MAG: SRPBCC family protein, partial [Pseudomonadota bacterium]
LALCVPALPAGAEPVYVEPESMGPKLDVAALMPLLSEGDLCMVTSKENGRLKQATAMTLINAPQALVWETVVNFAAYPEFMPTVDKAEIVERVDGEVVVDYRLEVPGPNIDFTVRHRFIPQTQVDVWLENDDGPLKTGGWRFELLPVDENRTLLIYDFYTDMSDTNWLVRILLKNHPVIESGINVGSALISVQSMKKRAESQFCGKTAGK